MKGNHKKLLIYAAIAAAVGVVIYVYRQRKAAQQATAADQSLADQQALGGFGSYATPMPTGGVSSYPEYLPAPANTDTKGLTDIASALGAENTTLTEILARIDHQVPAPVQQPGKQHAKSHTGQGGHKAKPKKRQPNRIDQHKRGSYTDNPGHIVTVPGDLGPTQIVKGTRKVSSSAPHNTRQHQNVAPPQHQLARPRHQRLGRDL